jgi:hypothetical protein
MSEFAGVFFCLIEREKERERESMYRGSHHFNAVFLGMGEINKKASQDD